MRKELGPCVRGRAGVDLLPRGLIGCEVQSPSRTGGGNGGERTGAHLRNRVSRRRRARRYTRDLPVRVDRDYRNLVRTSEGANARVYSGEIDIGSSGPGVIPPGKSSRKVQCRSLSQRGPVILHGLVRESRQSARAKGTGVDL